MAVHKHASLAANNHASLLDWGVKLLLLMPQDLFKTRSRSQRVCRCEMEKLSTIPTSFCLISLVLGLLWRGACALTGKFATRQAASPACTWRSSSSAYCR